MLYLNLCETCQKKANHKIKGLVIRPINSDEMNSRAQIDLIDIDITFSLIKVKKCRHWSE